MRASERRQKVYVAGPMTGIEGHNYPAFHVADKALSQHYEVLNPAKNFNGDRTLDYHVYMREDLGMLLQADEVAFLAGWEGSKGAQFEYQVALMLGLPCWEVYPDEDGSYKGRPIYEKAAPESPRTDTSIAREAADLVIGGERQQYYGHPYHNMKQTGELWGSIIGREPIPPKIVALMMVAAKISRETHRPKRDNLVDMAGYAEVANIVEEYAETQMAVAGLGHEAGR